MNMLKDAVFKTSSFSPTGPVHYCVAVAKLPNGNVAVKHSRNPDLKKIIVFEDEEWAAHIKGVKAGEFDF